VDGHIKHTHKKEPVVITVTIVIIKSMILSLTDCETGTPGRQCRGLKCSM
jgi:hypothetical protein